MSRGQWDMHGKDNTLWHRAKGGETKQGQQVLIHFRGSDNSDNDESDALNPN